MSFIYSRALVEAYSQANCLDIDASALSSVIPMPKPCLWHDKTMDPSRISRFGMTCEPSTESHGEELLTLWLEDSRVRTLALPERGGDSMESEAVSGKRWPGSFARYSQDTSSWKTPQCSLLGDLDEFSETWPDWGSMRNGECWERMPLEHYTGAIESGSLLPTPSGCRSGKNHVAGRLDEWGGSSNPWRGTEIGKISSPAFEEWVMGWPEQWTELTPYETGKFQGWLQQHGKF